MSQPMGPCASCSEFVSLRAEVCPTCGEGTGFSAWTRLRASPGRLFGIAAALGGVILVLSYVGGMIQGAQLLAESRAAEQGEVQPETIDAARRDELNRQVMLRAKLRNLEAQAEALGPLAEKAKRIEAELRANDIERVRAARVRRQEEFDALFRGQK